MSTKDLEHDCTPVNDEMPLAQSGDIASTITIDSKALEILLGHIRDYRVALFVSGEFDVLAEVQETLDMFTDELLADAKKVQA